MVNDSSTHFLLSKNLLWMGFIFLVKKRKKHAHTYLPSFFVFHESKPSKKREEEMNDLIQNSDFVQSSE